jgi:hypothetical protein
MTDTPLLDNPSEDPDLAELLAYLGRQHDRQLTRARRVPCWGYSRTVANDKKLSAERSAERFGRWFDALERALDKPTNKEWGMNYRELLVELHRHLGDMAQYYRDRRLKEVAANGEHTVEALGCDQKREQYKRWAGAVLAALERLSLDNPAREEWGMIEPDEEAELRAYRAWDGDGEDPGDDVTLSAFQAGAKYQREAGNYYIERLANLEGQIEALRKLLDNPPPVG